MDDLRSRLREGVKKYEHQRAVDDVKEKAARLRDLEREGNEIARQQVGWELAALKPAIRAKKAEIGRDNPELLAYLKSEVEEPVKAAEDLLRKSYNES